MVAYQQKESTARVASIIAHSNLSKQQQGSEIMRQMLTQAETAANEIVASQYEQTPLLNAPLVQYCTDSKHKWHDQITSRLRNQTSSCDKYYANGRIRLICRQ